LFCFVSFRAFSMCRVGELLWRARATAANDLSYSFLYCFCFIYFWCASSSFVIN
jgi:hypothetical protein